MGSKRRPDGADWREQATSSTICKYCQGYLRRGNERHGGRFYFHYTPIHASWVNQVELFFGIVQRRVLRYGVFDTLELQDEAVIGFIDHWNVYECHPFNWTFKGYGADVAMIP